MAGAVLYIHAFWTGKRGVHNRRGGRTDRSNPGISGIYTVELCGVKEAVPKVYMKVEKKSK